MYITSPKRKNGSTVVRLVESFWKEGKVKNRIIKTIGQSKDSKIVEKYKQEAKKLLEQHKKGLLSLSSLSEKIPIDLLRFQGERRHNHGFEDIFGTAWEDLGFKDLIETGRKKEAINQVLREVVFMRVFSPSSKLRSCSLIEKFFSKQPKFHAKNDHYWFSFL